MSVKERLFGTKHPDRYDVVYYSSLYVSAVIIAFVGAFPLYWMAMTAFKTRGAILNETFPESLLVTPDTFTLSRFEVLIDPTIFQYVLNSVIVTVTAIVGTLVFSLIAGYGLARFRFRGKNTFARVLLFGYMFSPIVLVLPLYLIFDSLGFLNNRFAMGLALSALAMPFSVWLMWKYINTIPRAMEESAWIAGAERWESFVKVVVPQTKPALIANSLFAFAIAWNDFTFAQVLLPAQEKRTFAPGLLQMISGAADTGFGEFMAIGLVLTLPAFLFAYFLQSYLLRGFEIRAL